MDGTNGVVFHLVIWEGVQETSAGSGNWWLKSYEAKKSGVNKLCLYSVLRTGIAYPKVTRT